MGRLNSASDLQALARAFRWQRMLDEGISGTIDGLARREKVNRGYMCRVLRLMLLAPDLVELILEGRQGPQVNLTQFLDSVEVGWEAQRFTRALSTRGLGAHDVPSGVTTILRPPLFLDVRGMWIVIEPSSETVAIVFTLPPFD